MITDHLIIGGGAAGVFAALQLAAKGASCRILEKNGQIGKKLRITGKGRCNLTNACDLEALMAHIPRNPKFLYSAFSQCMPQDVMAYVSEECGVPLKVERGNRVFPVSDKAVDVVAGLQAALRRYHIPVEKETVRELLLQDGRCVGVKTASGRTYTAKNVLLATGGASYPATGSTGDGYALAQQAGHTILAPAPSLVPLTLQERWCADTAGLTLRNISVQLQMGKRCLYSALGELQFMPYGISGPLTLTASAVLPETVSPETGAVLYLNLKPGLTAEQLVRRIQRDCEANPKQAMGLLLRQLLPLKMVLPVLQTAEIPPECKAAELSRAKRLRLQECLQRLPLHITGKRPLAEAIVTRGGVCIKEVDAKTMASRKVKGLYFAGELLDVDGFTGGFNLQIAFATAHCAANAMLSDV